jgi:hypothetical protein
MLTWIDKKLLGAEDGRSFLKKRIHRFGVIVGVMGQSLKNTSLDQSFVHGAASGLLEQLLGPA